MCEETDRKVIESCYEMLRFKVTLDLIIELIHPCKHI